jgi:hypothetical protein
MHVRPMKLRRATEADSWKATGIHVDIQTMHAPSSVIYSPFKTKDTNQASLKWIHAKKL